MCLINLPRVKKWKYSPSYHIDSDCSLRRNDSKPVWLIVKRLSLVTYQNKEVEFYLKCSKVSKVKFKNLRERDFFMNYYSYTNVIKTFFFFFNSKDKTCSDQLKTNIPYQNQSYMQRIFLIFYFDKT